VKSLQPVKSFGLVVLLGSLCFAGSAAGEQQIPIIDLDFHPAHAWDLGALVSLFDRVGVAKAGNGPVGFDSLALHFAVRHPNRFIPFAGQVEILAQVQQDGERVWTRDSPGITAYLSKLEIGLRFRRFRGIGLLYLNNLDSHPVGFPAMRYPVDSPLMKRLWSYSAIYGVPLSVDSEATPQSVAEMERLLKTDRRGTFIWAHAGFFAEPRLLRSLFERHLNLFCDLSRRDERGLPAALPISTDRTLHSSWKGLLEEFSDRFVIGTDVVKPSLKEYEDVIGYWRHILSQLSPSTAENLAHTNAERILGLP